MSVISSVFVIFSPAIQNPPPSWNFPDKARKSLQPAILNGLYGTVEAHGDKGILFLLTGGIVTISPFA